MESLPVKYPCFIIGTGRSGTTILFDVLGHHPHVSWLYRRTNNHPDNLRPNQRVLKLVGNPLLHDIVYKRTGRGECWDFWEYHCKGFREPCRDLLASDVTQKNKKTLHRIFSQLTSAKRPRLLFKITGWPRVGFLKEVFPDAKFVNIIRDPRATAFSLMNIRFWSGWKGPSNWRLGPLPSEYEEKWLQSGRSFAELAGLYWMILMDAYEDAKKLLPASEFLDIRYEDFCQDSVGIVRQISDFYGLEYTPLFEARVRQHSTPSMNFK